ncbi:Di-copper centre-containing protein [Bimuria novae-zelandiae CBS 107.79]|uniref:tyrosinase n=1 Tax=Bimuria novae-zelandiae CBS 107.79 TaxID=1447943 RepID=A0A6A5VBL3_9PLEO|nr:Di-copper centre-containing protein [Bimuria novae-zelandiae CBS 107.79]
MARFCLPLTTFLLSIVYFCASSTCTPVNSNSGPHVTRDLSSLLQREDGIFSVLGVAGLGGTAIHPRLEIRDLERNYPDRWNIFLLGLQRFQSVSQYDKLSYFQIAGIHGRPFMPWDGAQGDDSFWSHYSGYCTHDSNLFPTWHRPYLALFEEVLYLNCREAISGLPDGEVKARYFQALSSFRLPYWDWAAIPPTGEGTLPASVQKEMIDVVGANGTLTIRNPLHGYKFHPIPTWVQGEQRWNKYPSTVRNPTTKDANAQSNDTKTALDLESNRKSMQARIYDFLAMQHEYLNMSTKLIPGDSMESIHGTIHDTVGGDGTMTWLFYSAYDPIFWLHHCNVDRLLAMWQTLNPNEWVESFMTPSPTFYTPANYTVDGNTPLKPFHKDDTGNFWTSNSIRDHTIFGYTYPDLIGLTNATRHTLSARGKPTTLIARVNALYGPNASPLLQDPSHLKRGIATTGAPHFTGKRQYTLTVQVSEFRDPGALKIFAFFGKVQSKIVEWPQDVGFVGVTSMLTASKDTMKETHTVIPLTPALEAKARAGELRSLGEGDVKKFLRRQLRWRVANNDLTDCETEEAPGLQISVTWKEIEPAVSMDEFPRPTGEVKELLCAAEAKKGHF